MSEIPVDGLQFLINQRTHHLTMACNKSQ